MRRTALLLVLCGALAPAPASAHSIPYRDAFQVAQAAISGAAWNLTTGRWRVAWCERWSAHRWRCVGNVDIHGRDGWTNCALHLTIFYRGHRDLGGGGWPRLYVGHLTCARPTPNPTIPEGRVRT